VNIWREVAEAGAGLVVNCDASEVSRALDAVIEDPAARAVMSERARRLVAERFNWAAAGQRMVEVYHEILAECGRDAAASRGQREGSACA
jgi:glycosyltransferase involved in cell wall biosynthesis